MSEFILSYYTISKVTPIFFYLLLLLRKRSWIGHSTACRRINTQAPAIGIKTSEDHKLQIINRKKIEEQTYLTAFILHLFVGSDGGDGWGLPIGNPRTSNNIQFQLSMNDMCTNCFVMIFPLLICSHAKQTKYEMNEGRKWMRVCWSWGCQQKKGKVEIRGEAMPCNNNNKTYIYYIHITTNLIPDNELNRTILSLFPLSLDSASTQQFLRTTLFEKYKRHHAH